MLSMENDMKIQKLCVYMLSACVTMIANSASPIPTIRAHTPKVPWMSSLNIVQTVKKSGFADNNKSVTIAISPVSHPSL